MADRPILFSAPMIRAILDGRKTQTRRVLGLTGKFNIFAPGVWTDDYVLDHGNAEWRERNIPIKVGDRLWCRETFSYDRLDVDRDRFMPPWYWADGNPEDGDWTRPKPSIHMPRIYSRITLYVTEVRVQRLQEISEADAKAEGAGLYVPGHGFITEDELRADPGYSNFLAPRLGFEAIWTEINGAASWAENPWVAAYTFAPLLKNIDAAPAQLEEVA